MTTGAKRDYLTIILIVVVVAMGFEIVYLVQQNRKLSAMLENPGSSFQTLARSDIVPPLSGTDIYGQPLEIAYTPGSPHTVLIWFSPTCHSCEENLAFWREIYAAHNFDRVRFLGLCDVPVEEARAFAQQHQVAFPIVSITDDRLIEVYKGRVMPQTVLVSPTGEIIDSWPGALSEQFQRIIRDSLSKL